MSRRTRLSALALAALVAGCGSSPGPEGRAGPSPALRLQPSALRLGGTPFAIAVSRRAAGVERPVPTGKAPSSVAVGAGAVWAANAGDGTVTRVAVAR